MSLNTSRTGVVIEAIARIRPQPTKRRYRMGYNTDSLNSMQFIKYKKTDYPILNRIHVTLVELHKQ